jgi:hypothetical protein
MTSLTISYSILIVGTKDFTIPSSDWVVASFNESSSAIAQIKIEDRERLRRTQTIPTLYAYEGQFRWMHCRLTPR